MFKINTFFGVLYLPNFSDSIKSFGCKSNSILMMKILKNKDKFDFCRCVKYTLINGNGPQKNYFKEKWGLMLLIAIKWV